MTTAQAAALAHKWIRFADEDHQLGAGDVYLAPEEDYDNSTAESAILWPLGHTVIEVRSTCSRDGNPHTFRLDRDDVTLDTALSA